MASDGPTPRKGREPPTIDATATEVKPADTKPAAQSGSSAKPDKAAETPPPPPKSDAPPVAAEPAGVDMPPPPPRAQARPPRRRSLFWPMLGSAILGAILALAVLAAIWRYNVLEPFNIDVGGKLLAARIAGLEAKIRDRERAPVAVVAPRPAANPADAQALRELSAKLAKLEAAVQAPRPAPAPNPANEQALREPNAKVAKLEAALQAPRPEPTLDPALAARLSALETAIKPLDQGIAGSRDAIASANTVIASTREAVAAADKRDQDLAAGLREAGGRLDTTAKAIDGLIAAQKQAAGAGKADLDKVEARVVTLEATAKSLATSVNAADTADKSADRNMRTAILALALRNAVERGTPYAAELAALKPQLADAKVLAPLEPFAATGVPSQGALARELAGTVPAVTRVAEPGGSPAEGGLLARLKARASEFVQVRPAGGAPAPDQAVALAGLSAAAGQGDIAAMRADIAKLPPDAQAPAKAVIAKIEARDAAIAAAQRVTADALTALGKS